MYSVPLEVPFEDTVPFYIEDTIDILSSLNLIPKKLHCRILIVVIRVVKYLNFYGSVSNSRKDSYFNINHGWYSVCGNLTPTSCLFNLFQGVTEFHRRYHHPYVLCEYVFKSFT